MPSSSIKRSVREKPDVEAEHAYAKSAQIDAILITMAIMIENYTYLVRELHDPSRPQ